MNSDFSQLYSELGLQPDCSLEQFKLAYRRRIGELHPDRHGDAPVESDLPLKDIIALYAKATRFHHQHGRLPGSAPRAAAVNVANATPAWHAHDAARQSGQRAGTDAGTDARAAPPSRRAAVLAALSILALLVVVVCWDWNSPDTDTHANSTDVRVDPVAAAVAANTATLELGMDTATVLAIQGEPVGMRDGEWDYGPSWLRFDEGKLVDWYSSPMRRLKTADAAPRHEAASTAK
jgi:hypothetical protein